MMTFNFFFGVSLAKEILCVTDNLARALQKKDLSASEGKVLYKPTLDTLKSMKDNEFDKFWSETLEMSQKLEIGEPELKRRG